MSKYKIPNTIGFIVSSIDSSYRDSLVDSICNKFYDRGYKVLMGMTSHNLDRERELFKIFSELVDCILVISNAEKFEQIEDVVPSDIPVLFLINKPEGATKSAILENDYSAFYQAVVSYSASHHHKIAFVCSNIKVSSSKEVLKAYVDSLNSSQIPYDDNLIYDVMDNPEFDTGSMVSDMLCKGCGAIICTTPNITNRFLDYLLFNSQKNINHPISVYGYGNQVNNLVTQLNINVVVHPHNQIVTLAVEQALYLIKHPNQKNYRDFLVKGKLKMYTYDGINNT
ncbi:substrate-binding domain-containing protein [Lachnobacterium bovis]|uniref:substrate-binding domain-containing protein n=1 Tax=Lachnobacterium bovis TaxID=140626 RepID=UPI0003B5EFC7|nr:substrate-binding domain-containing protein [Lachnobacterium bovis]